MRCYARGLIPKRPHPETGEWGPTHKQWRFLELDCKEAFFGGAAGPGKSDALLMAAVMFVDIPDYHAIIFRKTIRSLQREGGLIPRSKEWWMGKAQWTGDTLTWSFPTRVKNHPATVGFGYLNHEDDYIQYGSTEYQYQGFDELPEIREHDYRFLSGSRLRRTELQRASGIPLRVRSAGNPIGPGVAWVKRWFNLPHGLPLTKPFIPARLEDNPHLDLVAYEETLDLLDPVTRARLRDGDWDIKAPGGMFNRAWFKVVRELPSDLIAVRYWDLAATAPAPGKKPDWTAGALVSFKDGVWYIIDIVRAQLRPAGVESLIKLTAELDQDREDLEFVHVYMEQEPGSAGVNTIDYYARRILPGFSFRGHKTTGSKELRAQPVSSAAEARNVCLLAGPWINDMLDEFEAFPESDYKDQVDAVSGAFITFSQLPRRPYAK